MRFRMENQTKNQFWLSCPAREHCTKCNPECGWGYWFWTLFATATQKLRVQNSMQNRKFGETKLPFGLGFCGDGCRTSIKKLQMTCQVGFYKQDWIVDNLAFYFVRDGLSFGMAP